MAVLFNNFEGLQVECESQGLLIHVAGPNRPRVDWIVYADSGDQDQNMVRRAWFHLHVFFQFNPDPPHRMSAISARSQEDHQQLTNHPFETWTDMVQGMDQRTRDATVSFVQTLHNIHAQDDL